MSDAVFDATVIAYSNRGLLEAEKTQYAAPGINLITTFISGKRQIRVTPKLLHEYSALTKTKSDLIEIFIALLTSDRATHIKKNTLTRQDYIKSIDVKWPSHDQHLLAAAIDGFEPTIYATEEKHTSCNRKIKSEFSITISKVAIDTSRF